jgi:chaperonin cofactor prefoldin
MALTQEDLRQVTAYLQTHIDEWLPQPVLHLSERIVRVEEELKHQRELMMQGFANIERRFEDVNKRFEDVDKRFEDVNKRFEDVNKRFEDMDKRFSTLTWMIGIGFVVVTSLVTVFALLA